MLFLWRVLLMRRRQPVSTRTVRRCPSTTLVRSTPRADGRSGPCRQGRPPPLGAQAGTELAGGGDLGPLTRGCKRPLTWCCSSKSSCDRSEEHTSELQSLMRISYDVFCLKKKIIKTIIYSHLQTPLLIASPL